MAQDFKAFTHQIITEHPNGHSLNVGRWHDIAATSESSSCYIISDIITASYEYITTRSTKNLLVALKNAKKSKLKFKGCYSGDEYTYDEQLQVYLKFFFYFNENKSLEIRCRAKDKLKNSKIYIISTSTRKKCPIKFWKIIADIYRIEAEYISLS